MTTEDEASKRCCEMLRKMRCPEDEADRGVPIDIVIIDMFQDEWSLMMQTWKETKKQFSKD